MPTYQCDFAQSTRPVSVPRTFHTRIVSTEKSVQPTVLYSSVDKTQISRFSKNINESPELFEISVDGNIHEEKRGQRQQPMDQKIEVNNVNMPVVNILSWRRFSETNKYHL